jgi:ribosomal protein L37E
MEADEIIGAAVDVDRRSEEYIQLVRACFPEIQCLRCGDDEFLIFPNITGPSGLNSNTNLGAVTLACSRCGHLEQHLLGRLRTAVKNNTVPFPDRTKS